MYKANDKINVIVLDSGKENNELIAYDLLTNKKVYVYTNMYPNIGCPLTVTVTEETTNHIMAVID